MAPPYVESYINVSNQLDRLAGGMESTVLHKILQPYHGERKHAEGRFQTA